STGDPVRPPAVAVAVSAPVTLPSVRVAVAMPLPLVDEGDVILPPPVVAAQVTEIPATGLPPRSVTATLYGVGRLASIVSVCALPPFKAIVAAPPAVAVAEKLTGEPVRPPTVAVAVCAPAVEPSTRVADAMPLEFVFEDGVIEPPPPAAHVTVMLLTGLAARSVTSTV